MDRCNCICSLCANLCEESRVSRKNDIPSETYVVSKVIREKTSRYEELSLMILKINNKRNLLLLLDIVRLSPLVCLWNLQLSYVLLSGRTRIVYETASDIFGPNYQITIALFLYSIVKTLHFLVQVFYTVPCVTSSFFKVAKSLSYCFIDFVKKKKKKRKNGNKEKQISRQSLGQREAAFIQELIKRIVPEFS